MPLKSIPFFGDYSLRYGWSGIEAIMEVLGNPSFTEFDKIVTRPTLKTVRLVIWAGLIHDKPLLKKEDVPKILDEYLSENTFQSLVGVMTRALEEANIITQNLEKPKGEEESPLPLES